MPEPMGVRCGSARPGQAPAAAARPAEPGPRRPAQPAAGPSGSPARLPEGQPQQTRQIQQAPQQARQARQVQQAQQAPRARKAPGLAASSATARLPVLMTAARNLAADAVSGASGDVCAVRRTRYGLRLLIGDVRGKGPRAAVGAAALHRAFAEAADRTPTLPALVEVLERALLGAGTQPAHPAGLGPHPVADGAPLRAGAAPSTGRVDDAARAAGAAPRTAAGRATAPSSGHRARPRTRLRTSMRPPARMRMRCRTPRQRSTSRPCWSSR
ncbi:SpoIIE family protein phosphatase [Streptomyces sp. 796.1]|uniref:SpoIIE family protein phosphatase n=1 Tax=Streptomyces sp. 796.1 TaxID=3163029 RepID=UPI0039C99066